MADEETQDILAPGTPAPAFHLQSAPGQFVSLSEGRGRNLILAFYPADWSPICGDELALFNELIPEFDKFNAKVVGVSVD
ncbi:MAG: redoxin domain-containing protein, partial [Tepidiformaceae bacterium]